MKGTDWVILAVVAVLAVLLGGFALSTHDVKTVEVPKIVQGPTVYVEANSTVQDLAAEKILEVDNFEVVAYDLAVAELEDDDYEDLFDYLVSQNVSIEDEEDLSSVVIKDSDVSGVDVDDQDADVELELKVYYEDSDGDDKKVYVNVEFVVEDGEVEEVEYSLA